jgi:Ser/Thr protein kinase RdoA (MazF antagonist)/predicted esterase
LLARSTEGLADHLAARHGVEVTGLAELDLGVFRVERAEGEPWVARVFPAARPLAEVEGDAAILRALERAGFPAERCATGTPVTELSGQGVLVTTFVPGARAGGGRAFAYLGALLGRLHAHPAADLRPGGAWHHLVAQGGPGEEIQAALELLSEVGGEPELMNAVAELDDCADLPHAFVHPDFVPANAIENADGGITVVDWTGSGRGPRLWSLGALLFAAGARSPKLVDVVVSRYRRHTRLTPDELDRLPDAIRARPLLIDCWAVGVGRKSARQVVSELAAGTRLAERIAEQARAAFLAPDSGDDPPADPSMAGTLVTESFDYDGGRKVTVYVPPAPPEAVVFAGDGQGVAQWGALLEAADVPPTMIVGVHGLADETLRLHEYSPVFDAERFAAHEKFFVEDVGRWVRARFGLTLPPERTAVYGASAGGELALALGLRHPDVYGTIFSGSPGAGYQPTGTLLERIPRTYLVAGSSEPFFLANAARWASALRDAGADVVLAERDASHGSALWRAEFPLMVAWAFGR